jgi:hypothetical protein
LGDLSQGLSVPLVYFFIKSYWITDQRHLRSEWIHFQPFKYSRRAESSELFPKPSKEVQATLHGTPFLQCTQITNRNPRTHNQRGKRINETMSFQPKSFTVPNQMVYCLIITCTRTHIRSSTIRNPPRCDRTEQCPDNRSLTQCIHLPLKPGPKCHIWKNRMG